MNYAVRQHKAEIDGRKANARESERNRKALAAEHEDRRVSTRRYWIGLIVAILLSGVGIAVSLLLA